LPHRDKLQPKSNPDIRNMLDFLQMSRPEDTNNRLFLPIDQPNSSFNRTCAKYSAVRLIQTCESEGSDLHIDILRKTKRTPED
jgi:hypothetical protein